MTSGGPREEYELRPAGGAGAIDWEKELNPQQLQVVTAGGGPLLVIAGAGSGKTRTLTYRVARLVESGIPAAAILLLTFTNKAAREMLNRAEVLLGGAALGVLGGTFHHAGHMALRRHGADIGLPRNFTIVDRGDASDLIEGIADGMGLSKDRRFPKGEVLIDIVSTSANTGKAIPGVVESRYPDAGEMLPDIEKVARRYATRKVELGIVDFDDLLTGWLRVLEESEEARASFQRRFAYVLVDEYQDTNLLQAKIVDLVAAAHKNLMVVGDDAQSIYSFRGANFDNIIRFPERYPGAKTFRLEINYRSTPEILALANASIAHNTIQFAKNLQAVSPSGSLPSLVPLERSDEQAQYVAQRIQDLENEGVPLDEIAVLYRAHYHAMELQMELARRNIPFEVRSGVRFTEQAHIKDATSYLRLAVNPRDELAWKRLLRLFEGVGKVTAEKVWKSIEQSRDPLADLEAGSLKGPKAAGSALADMKKTMEIIRAQPDRPWAQLEAVLLTGYEEFLKARYDNAMSRIQDLKTLADFARKFTTTEAFLSELALMSGGESGTTEDGGPPERRVVLTTVHQAKGLEWSAVFLIWLVDGRFPDARSLGEGGEEEERRLFYVAMTRARRHLFLCYPVTAREGAFGGVVQRPSRFIEELPPNLLKQVMVRRSWNPRPPQPPEGDDRWMDGDSSYDD